MKFQALGSHYSFGWAWRQLFALGSTHQKDKLIDALSTRYGGLACLYAKGRHALSEGIRIAASASDRSAVVINGLTCSVVVDAVLAADATPIFADVSASSCDFSAEKLDELCRHDSNIGTVVIQNTFGVPCDITTIEAIAKKHNLIIIEDLAHAIGQTYPDGREVGTVGDIVMLSFGRDKLLDVVNGGALIVRTSSLVQYVDEPTHLPRTIDQLRDRIYPLLTWLVRHTYTIGLGRIILIAIYRLHLAVRSSDGTIDRHLTLPLWQATLAYRRFVLLSSLNDHRRATMLLYHRYLGDQLLSAAGTIRGAVRTTNRNHLLGKFKKSGYELSDTWYDAPIGPKRKFRSYHYDETVCPEANRAANELINLPTHREMSENDIINIANIVRHS